MTEALTLFNTLSRSKEALPAPGAADPVKLYTCGPTVYNHVHIGNLRAFVFYDLLRRSLEWLGYEVRHVMNLTDVDDKTIRGSQAEGISLRAFTERYTESFLEDLDALRVVRPHALPRATDAIEPMVSMVQTLLGKGLAYRSEDGSIYFKISAFEGYGKLSQLDARSLQAGAGGRVAADEYDKDNVQDFALWKAWSEEDGEVFWETALGKGRPGWHLECSALAMEHLGSSIDIHAGGVDLTFPHHENEIAQSEGVSGEQFSRFWVHNEHLMVGGKKMSKSLGNFYTYRQLRDLAQATGREVRYALLAGHYRKKLNLQVTYEGQGEARRATAFDSLIAAREALGRLDTFRQALEGASGAAPPASARERLAETRTKVREAIADDLNLPAALGELFKLIKEVNKLADYDAAFAGEVLDFLRDFDRVLGVLEPEEGAEAGLNAEEQALFAAFEAAYQARDFATSDGLRSQLKERGIGVQSRKGQPSTWTRI